MFSNGLRSHGIIEESEEIRMDKESIVLGSGDLYCTDFQGTNEAIPDDAVIETEDNRLGHIKGGFLFRNNYFGNFTHIVFCFVKLRCILNFRTALNMPQAVIFCFNHRIIRDCFVCSLEVCTIQISAT